MNRPLKIWLKRSVLLPPLFFSHCTWQGWLPPHLQGTHSPWGLQLSISSNTEFLSQGPAGGTRPSPSCLSTWSFCLEPSPFSTWGLRCILWPQPSARGCCHLRAWLCAEVFTCVATLLSPFLSRPPSFVLPCWVFFMFLHKALRPHGTSLCSCLLLELPFHLSLPGYVNTVHSHPQVLPLSSGAPSFKKPSQNTEFFPPIPPLSAPILIGTHITLCIDSLVF